MRAIKHSTARNADPFTMKRGSAVSRLSDSVTTCRKCAAVAVMALAPSFLCLASEPAPAQRLDELHAQFNETLDREVMAAHLVSAAKLRTSYLNALEQALAASTKAANLGDSLALRDEIKRINTTPEAKLTSEEPPPPALAKLREKYETAMEKLEADKKKKSQPYYAMYETVLTNYQKDLTKKGDLDGASSVQERLKEVAQKKPIEIAKTGDSRLAKVDIDNVDIEPFKKGVPVHGDTDKFTWEVIPERFAGYRFSRDKSRYVGVLRFKVISDGTVYLGCSDRWGGGGNDGPWKNEVVTQTQMEADGWKLLKGETARGLGGDHGWVFFSRECKAGESFAIRTEKYVSPILLLEGS